MEHLETNVDNQSIIADYTALLNERRKLTAKLADIRQAVIDEFVQRTLAEAESLEIDLLEVLASQDIGHKRRRSSAVQVKYRDPNNPENIWTGRGRPPKWMQDYIEAGKSQTEFLAQ